MDIASCVPVGLTNQEEETKQTIPNHTNTPMSKSFHVLLVHVLLVGVGLGGTRGSERSRTISMLLSGDETQDARASLGKGGGQADDKKRGLHDHEYTVDWLQ